MADIKLENQKMRKIVAIMCLVTFSVIEITPRVSLAAPAAAPDSALSQVTATINQIVDAVEAAPGADNTQKRRGKLREIINPRFDFNEMARRSLGPAWNDITGAEQQDFTAVFSDLLARTYLNRIETVKRGMVAIDGEEAAASNGDEAVQKTTVKTSVTSKGDTFPINYKLLKGDNGWRVYDVVIENIGLVANYRNEFAGIIRKEKFEGLMQRLREKNKGATT